MPRSPGLDVLHTHPATRQRGPGERASREERWSALGTAGRTLWLTGLPGAGKSTLAAELERRLLATGRWACVLDGDALRTSLTSDLGFSREDRRENVRRVAAVAATCADAGAIAIVAVVSPYAEDRDEARTVHEQAGLRFSEVWVNAPATVCAERDPKGLYAKAARGAMQGLTGAGAPYEPPRGADMVLRTDEESVEVAVSRLEAFLQLA